ncbi:hypothetical protein I79_026049 [Cricetulus griseus]|uniref:Uncharacterized protein n=1 Tax=Cricetulus griseus TaxID=10029 RepID=G3IPW5_CRIGR|nr:hypothetical protein I79_026049 [Cricetulus griseus]
MPYSKESTWQRGCENHVNSLFQLARPSKAPFTENTALETGVDQNYFPELTDKETRCRSEVGVHAYSQTPGVGGPSGKHCGHTGWQDLGF